MSDQMIFKRYEMKYQLTQKQKMSILKVMEPYMKLDKYGRATIRNIYFDTESYQLIRRSLERPAYKEKLRLRSYGRPMAEDTVFVELKKSINRLYTSEGLPFHRDRRWNAFVMESNCQFNLRLPRKSIIFVPIIKNCLLLYFFPMRGRLFIH